MMISLNYLLLIIYNKKTKSENFHFLYLKIHKDFDDLLSEYKINVNRE